MHAVPAGGDFWIALLQIIGIDIVLSGDNAVVIALASRNLPPAQRRTAVLLGSGAAIGMRVVLAVAATLLLNLPGLKLVGAALLLWIGISLLRPGSGGDGHQGAVESTLAGAVRTILLADAAMSLDNVVAIAAVAKGSVLLLVLGLAISIPLIVFTSTMLLRLMDRYPVIITAGAALLGYVAGDMAVTDPVARGWLETHAPAMHLLAPALGVVLVVAIGKWLAARQSSVIHEVPSADQTTGEK